MVVVVVVVVVVIVVDDDAAAVVVVVIATVAVVHCRCRCHSLCLVSTMIVAVQVVDRSSRLCLTCLPLYRTGQRAHTKTD